ncbi:TolC family protein [Flavobacterium sharifuzzamanii]|uniref:TolC family protein n=1 Tax=Flavobacterium sharifuzzamanii TaxID=2211133 RepID=UPI000DAD946B|nr:TolC family protein [Flavobacterium sharifuzzamanii]KAF2080133.1 TolC family protein [Flavobacterium sharifuzzamanii]
MKNIFSLLLALLAINFFGQETKKMTFSDAVKLAQEKSVDGIKFKNQYQSLYWDFQAFKTENLPFVKLDLQPFTYNKQVIQRYNSVTNRDEYRKQQTLNVYGGLTVEQKLPFSGGSLYLESNLGKLTGYGYNKYTTFSSTFGRVGINQPILGYNAFKWRKKIEPLRFSKAKKEFIAAGQEINLKTLNLFFDLLSANQQLSTAVVNAKNAAQLFQIGVKRFEIAGIEKDELLQLELNDVNAAIEVQQMKKMQSFANSALCTYLGISDYLVVEPLFDNLNVLSDFKIDYIEAVELMKNNNPEIEGFTQQLLEAEQRIAMVRGEGGFKMNLGMSLGIDQQADELRLLYQLPPLDQQRVEIGITIPILDWGMQNRNLQRVRKDLEVAKASITENQQELKQRISNVIQNFNLQAEVVQSAARADAIAQQSFSLTNERFKLAKTNVVALNAAIASGLSAKRNYIQAVRNYWEYYFMIQKMTGYNFIKKENLPFNE